MSFSVLHALAADWAFRADGRFAALPPATGSRKNACPGYIIDHVTPLCAGGADHPLNMQWQTIEAGKAEDRLALESGRAPSLDHTDAGCGAGLVPLVF